MKRTTLVSLLLLVVVGGSGCAKIKEFLDKRRGRQQTATQQQATPTPADSQKAAAPAPPPPSRTLVSQGPPRPLQDTPYNPTDTGTLHPGMSERDVYTIWGGPVAVRRMGEMTYLFYRNGCEYSCGTHDVVTLKNNQIVDVISRYPGHAYSGVSSSPPGRVPAATKGDTLQVVPPQAP